VWKYLFAIFVSTAVIATSVYLFRHREALFRPDVRKLGGTRIVFPIDSGKPDETYLTAMRRRFDPRGRLGVVVRHEGNAVEIDVPRGTTHDDTVARVVRLAGRPGKFAFLPVANAGVDDGVAKHVQATHSGKKSAARTAPPATPMNPLGGREFSVSAAGVNPRQYRWVRLDDLALAAWQLDSASLAGGNVGEKAAVDRAARTGSLLTPNAQPEAMLLVARLPGEAGPAFFLLVRDESDEAAVASELIRQAESETEARGPSSIRLRFQGDGWVRMMAINHGHDAVRSIPPVMPRGGFARRHFLAIVIDDRVAALPVFAMSQRPEVILEVGGNDEERDDLVSLLRGGPGGVRLGAKPTRVETLEPGR
jgi:hypothetical protein